MAIVVGRGIRCCGAMPRCRACPVRVAADIRTLVAGQEPSAEHLAGIPPCLHKYEPLFRERKAQGGETPLRP